jgi:hypothetical protein
VSLQAPGSQVRELFLAGGPDLYTPVTMAPISQPESIQFNSIESGIFDCFVQSEAS